MWRAQLEDTEQDVLLNPTVLIEVLSDSTEAYDRGGKFAHYRRLASLREYLLVSQYEPYIDHFVRQTDDTWLLSEAGSLDAKVRFDAIGCELLLADVYDRVVFEPPPSRIRPPR